MARPTKEGLDYFNLDVDVDEKIELLEAKHGIIGFGVLVKLFQKIYKAGYYINVTEETVLLFGKRIDVCINSINSIINDSIRWKLFDKSLFDQFGILTSTGIQKRYVEATKKRKEICFIKEYLLLENVEEKYPQKVNVVINSINSGTIPEETGVSGGNNPQSKVKESKGKNINTPDSTQQQEPEPDPDASQPSSSPSGSSSKDKKITPFPVTTKNRDGYHGIKKCGPLFQGINTACDHIATLPSKKKRFSPQKWAQSKINEGSHPGAVMESLQGLSLYWDDAKDPWAVCDKILRGKNSQWNEKDTIAIHKEFKEMKTTGGLEFLTQGLFQEVS